MVDSYYISILITIKGYKLLRSYFKFSPLHFFVLKTSALHFSSVLKSGRGKVIIKLIVFFQPISENRSWICYWSQQARIRLTEF